MSPRKTLPDSGFMHGGSRQREAELAEAIREDERRQGRPLTQRERAAFAEGFLSVDHQELRLVAWRSGG